MVYKYKKKKKKKKMRYNSCFAFKLFLTWNCGQIVDPLLSKFFVLILFRHIMDIYDETKISFMLFLTENMTRH